jgi:beta-ribofuranosylaminobenzene 5'-phosphate synthase
MAAGDDVRAMLESVEARDGVELSPVERLLMATDGTVTHMMEALTRAPVDVDILDRTTNGGQLNRRVALRRSSDGSALVWADSAVRLYPLDRETEDALVEGDIGIGSLLREECAETRREILDMDAVWYDSGEFPEFINGTSTLYLRRSYRIYNDGAHIMDITEYFPKGLF